MPQLVKKNGSPYWIARFQIRGKDFWRSTKKTKKSEALAAMADIIAQEKSSLSVERLFDMLAETIAGMPVKEQLAERQALAERLLEGTSVQITDAANWQDVVFSHLSEIKDQAKADKLRRKMAALLLQGQSTKLSVSEVWKAWSNSPKKRNPGERTIEGYSAIWKRFLKWASKHKVQFLHDITPTMAEDYAADLWNSNVTPGTYNAHIKFLRSMFKVLTNRAGLLTNVWQDIPLMEKEQEGRRNLTTDELTEVCRSAAGSLRYMLGLGLYTGMRLGDVVNLAWSNVDLDRQTIEFMPMKTSRKKKIVAVHIHPVLYQLLLELREISKGDCLFPEERALYRRCRSDMVKKVQGHFEACGIRTKEKPSNGHRRRMITRVGFHSLRHSFVSLCAANNVPQVAIMELVGHGSPAMTRLYSHAGSEEKAKAIAALPAMSFEAGDTPANNAQKK